MPKLTDLKLPKKIFEKETARPAAGTEPMYFAFVVWGAIITSVLYFLGDDYLKFYNQEFGIEMEDFTYYEVLLKSYNVIKILNPNLLALLVLLISFIFTGVLVVRRKGGLVHRFIEKIGSWALFFLYPLLALLAATCSWFFFKGAFETARVAGVAYAQHVKTHLDEQNRIAFIFEPGVDKTFPLFIKEANARREFRLVARAKQSYYVMRKPLKGYDPVVYEIPRGKVNLAVIDK